MQSVNWDSQRDNQPRPSNLSRMHSWSMFCTGNSILSSAIKAGSIRAPIRTLFFPGAQLKGGHAFLQEGFTSYVSLLYTSSQQKLRERHHFHAKCSYQVVLGPCILSAARLLCAGLRSFPVPHKPAPWPQCPRKEAGCIQEPSNIQTENLLCKMTYANTRKQ